MQIEHFQSEANLTQSHLFDEEEREACLAIKFITNFKWIKCKIITPKGSVESRNLSK
jgi:hypothetical protein